MYITVKISSVCVSPNITIQTLVQSPIKHAFNSSPLQLFKIIISHLCSSTEEVVEKPTHIPDNVD